MLRRLRDRLGEWRDEHNRQIGESAAAAAPPRSPGTLHVVEGANTLASGADVRVLLRRYQAEHLVGAWNDNVAPDAPRLTAKPPEQPYLADEDYVEVSRCPREPEPTALRSAWNSVGLPSGWNYGTWWK